jgi:hypothetical protein
MNTISMVALIIGALFLIGLGLVSLVHDLLGRGPHEAPLIEDDGLNWPPRYRGSAAPPAADAVKGDDELAGCDAGRR